MCTVCSTTVPCAKSGLDRHAKCAMHLKNASIATSQMPIKESIQNLKNQNYRLTTESRICAFIAEQNLPFSISQSLLQLIKAICPTNTDEKGKLHDLKLSATKCTNIMRQGLGFHFSKTLT